MIQLTLTITTTFCSSCSLQVKHCDVTTCIYGVTERKSFDILALYKSDYYYYYARPRSWTSTVPPVHFTYFQHYCRTWNSLCTVYRWHTTVPKLSFI